MRRTKLYLTEWRNKRGFSQQELAAAVGVRQATISDIETGKAKVLRLTLLDKLASVLRTEPAKLLAPPEK
jgi:transcriptional regulator with XRE-family HTH domain